MVKTTIFAIFMVVLVLGMVMESQGQESCREYISGTEICQAKQCDDQCTVEYNGYGKCLAGTVCLCTFICKT
ncbi:BnaCnng13530D [Brassica napus]|uniref:BnaCnng13530D protein n=2 Tax=Brassica TaxID=3705 RepID=A0A078I970_BRANA|nr:BnaCnng13530D [Brassica napus]VDD62439.1 unnamed protein product [Brassica oleracea]